MIDTNAIRARVAVASPGPYIVGRPGGPSGPFWSIVNNTGGVVAMQVPNEGDARFIANAREDVPELLDALELLQAERDEFRKLIQRVVHLATFDPFRYQFTYGGGERPHKHLLILLQTALDQSMPEDTIE